jgi:hypothetical protein
VLGACILAGCGDAPAKQAAPPIELPGTVRPLYELSDGPMPWGAIPWPDDLYLDASGHVAVTDLPLEERAAVGALSDALTQLDGFALRPTLYVDFDGAVDEASLPDDADASLLPEATVFLIDADLSSPSAFERIPVTMRTAKEGRQLRVQPAYARGLQPGRRYALVVTSGVRAEAGPALAPARGFDVFLDAEAVARDALELRARAQYEPVLDALTSDGVPRARIAVLAVFTVQNVDRDLDEARRTVRAAVPAPLDVREVISANALDALLGDAPDETAGIVRGQGAAHEHLAALVQLIVRTPVFASVTPGQRTAFVWRDGMLEAQGKHDVPCVLLVPRSTGGAAGLPVAFFQHGLGGDRSDAVALGNELAAAGHAVLACDLPLHGSRSGRGDERNRFTGETSPDGFGDASLSLLGTNRLAGELPAHHPFYFRDALRQSVVDWLAIVAALEAGAWDAALGASPELEGLALARGSYSFVGIDVGAEIAMAVAAREAQIGANVLAFAGGAAPDDWLVAPGFPEYGEGIAQALDLAVTSEGVLNEPALELMRMALDGASGLGHASRLRRSDTNVLMFMAVGDERVRNASTEALAFAIGASLVDASPRFEPDLETDVLLPRAAIDSNVELPRGAVTRVLQNLDDATSSALVSSKSELRYDRPIKLPFVPLDEPTEIVNPTGALLRQIAFFVESYRACRQAAVVDDEPCPASVSALERTIDLGVRE